MASDGVREGLDDCRGAFAVPDSAADDEAREVVDDEQRVDGLLVDVAMQEVEVPKLVGPDCLVEVIVGFLAPGPGRDVAVGVQHAANRMRADLEAPAPELVANLGRAKAGVGTPLGQDARVPNRRGILVRSGEWIVRSFSLGMLRGFASPVAQRKPRDSEFLGRQRRTVFVGILQGLGALRRRVYLGDRFTRRCRWRRRLRRTGGRSRRAGVSGALRSCLLGFPGLVDPTLQSLVRHLELSRSSPGPDRQTKTEGACLLLGSVLPLLVHI